MLSRVLSAATVGLEGVLVEVEVDVAGRGFPTFTIVGLPSKAVDEAKDRVRTAIINAGYEMPDSRLTVNLAPADIPKEGSGFDLSIALGILAACGIIDRQSLENRIFLGELSLEGKVRKVAGVIAVALLAKERGISELYLPNDNAVEASLVSELAIYPAPDLLSLILHLTGKKPLNPFLRKSSESKAPFFEFDLADIHGQEQAKRALEIASAGFHNIHLMGTPGTGKTMLSRALPSILPPLDREEMLEVARIYSVVGLSHLRKHLNLRPFRAPHHTTSRHGLIGGGTNPAPGEISLAHRGVLFLDEFPEFPRSVLEALRQPLEDGVVTISRASGSLTFPCRFLLVAASNPCPCGYLGHPKKRCTCFPGAILKYRKRLSGPLLDRIDIHLDVGAVEEEKLLNKKKGESSQAVLQRVLGARERQAHRFKGLPVRVNSELSSAQVGQLCHLSDEAVGLLKQAISRLSLSARSYFKVIKIAQTIADLAGAEKIAAAHIAEALQYRAKEA